MAMAGFNFLLGFGCGLRLTLLPFIIVTLLVLPACAIWLVATENAALSAVAQWMLAAVALQAGYLGGVLTRSRLR